MVACGSPRAVAGPEGEPRARECAFPLPELPAAPELDARDAAIGGRFDRERAAALVASFDARVRLRGNHGYEESLEEARARLLSAGFAPEDVESHALGPEREIATPVAGELVLLGEDGAPDVVLHAFEDETDRDRLLVMPGSAAAEGVFEVVRPGGTRDVGAPPTILFGRLRARALFDAAKREGAVGIVSYDVHPVAAGQADAIGFAALPEGVQGVFGLSISEASARAIEARLAHAAVRVRVRAVVERERGRATTLIARVRGTSGAGAPIAFFAHADEPGAVDNASGVAALVELAVAVRRAIEEGALARPARDLLFMAGQELESVPRYLASGGTRPRAAIVLDMIGADPAVGAELLVERMPDPSAGRHMPPDVPSGWGEPPDVDFPARPSGLDAYVSFALARSDARGPPLPHRSHPFEGGSDHVPFLEAGVPAVLVWGFPDDAYHTSRDRRERVSIERMARVASAMGAAALGLASRAPSGERELLAAVEWTALARLSHLARARAPEGVEAFAAHYGEVLSGLDAPEAGSARRRVAEAYLAALSCVRSTPARRE